VLYIALACQKNVYNKINKMRTGIALLVCLLLCSTQLSAQEKFRRGRHINAYFVQPPSGWVGPDIMVHDGYNTNMGIFSLVAGIIF
jgi:hypothetical protein